MLSCTNSVRPSFRRTELYCRKHSSRSRCLVNRRTNIYCLQGQQQDATESEWRTQFVPGSQSARRPLSYAPTAANRARGAQVEDVKNCSQVATVSRESFGKETLTQQTAQQGWSWDALPAKYRVVCATSLSFVLCNMDKVNMSVAIIPMAQDFGWSPTVAGLVQSSFFYGYLLSQIPSGYITSRLGGRAVLPAGVAVWSAATAAVPVLAGTIPGLCISRALVGLGEAVAPAAATDIAARTVATNERARAISFIFGGLHVGSLLGLLLAPVVIHQFGWPAVFYLFGGAGIMWSLWWEKVLGRISAQNPELAVSLDPRQDQQAAPAGAGAAGPAAPQQASSTSVPWRGFMRNQPLQALAYTHFCNNWFHYTMLAWLPTYFTDTLSLDLTRAAQVSILPPIAAIFVSAVAGPTADALLAKGAPVPMVRKAAQCMAFLGPATCLLAAGILDDSPDNGPLLVGLVAMSLGLASFSLAGLYCNHADLSPRYAPILLSLTNTTGAVPGIIGVACTGILYDITNSWSLALFAPSIFLFLTGSATFVLFGRAEAQDFASNNHPFGFEEQLRRLVPAGLSGSESGNKAGEEQQRLKAREGNASASWWRGVVEQMRKGGRRD